MEDIRINNEYSSPICLFLPRKEILLKLIRACIDVKDQNELWFNRIPIPEKTEESENEENALGKQENETDEETSENDENDEEDDDADDAEDADENEESS